MIAASDVIAKLQADCAVLNFVGGAGSMPGATDQLRVTRSAFVMPPVETAQPSNTGTMVTRQRSDIRFQVTLGFMVRAASGADQSGDVDTVREAVKACLIGWTPNGVDQPVNLLSSSVLTTDLKSGIAFFALVFRSFYSLRAPSP